MAIIANPERKAQFWRSLLLAAEVEPQSPGPIRGASGLDHPVVAVGCNANQRRLIVVSADPDGRSAALAQADVQNAAHGWQVIFARPIAVNLGQIAQKLSDFLGKAEVTLGDLNRISAIDEQDQSVKKERIADFVSKFVEPEMRSIGVASLNWMATSFDVLSQLSHLETVPYAPDPAHPPLTHTLMRLGPLAALDPAEMDRRMGVCSIPLYEFTESDVEILHAGSDIDQCREVLRSRDILQYFFPPPDHLALALLDKRIVAPSGVPDALARAPVAGHPFGDFELLAADTKLPEVVDGLKDRGYCVEGEVAMELTPAGQSVRANVRFRPREGFLAKLARLISLKVDLSLRDLFGPHP